MTWNFAKELPTLGRPYNAIPEPTLVEGLSPDLPNHTRGIEASLWNWWKIKKKCDKVVTTDIYLKVEEEQNQIDLASNSQIVMLIYNCASLAILHHPISLMLTGDPGLYQ